LIRELRARHDAANAAARTMRGPSPTRRPWYTRHTWSRLVAFALILTLAPLAAPAHAAAGTPATGGGASGATYTNPIALNATEDCPDPSIIHGQTPGYTDWYVYCTSGPLNKDDRDSNGNLVLHRIKMLSSSDLVNWTYKGDVLGKSTDVPSTRPPWLATDNTWAPDIRYVNDTYYLYYTAPDTIAGGSGIFVVTSTTPLGPWSRIATPVVEPEAPPNGCCPADKRWTFDSALVTDDAAHKTYIFYGSFFGGISARLLSADGLSSSVSETQVRTGPTPLKDIAISNRYEGAYVVKHGGYYYLFASATNCCNGALTSYGVFAGRSQNVLGPYLDREGNPFLSGRVGGTPVVAPNGNSLVGIGHNAIFTDAAGQDWYISHAIQRATPTFTDGNGSTPPRRPLVMDPLDWGADGWPVVRGGFGASDTPQPAPAAQPGQASGYTPVFAQPEQPGPQIGALSDEFNGTSLGSQWTWVRQPNTSAYSVTNGAFNVNTQAADLQPQGLTPPPLASVLTEPTPAGDYVVDAKVHLNLAPEGCCQNYVQAGLVIYGDDSHYVKLVHVSIFETRQTEFGKHDSTGYGNGVVGTPSDDTYLRIVKTTGANGEEVYRAYTSQDGTRFVRGGVWTHALGSGSTAKIGLVSMGGSGYQANFDYVHVYTLAPAGGGGGGGGAATPELGSGELLATGLLPIAGVLLYRRRRRCADAERARGQLC
jgi:arabinan endo-1,5-alpha-L-arabinosidase